MIRIIKDVLGWTHQNTQVLIYARTLFQSVVIPQLNKNTHIQVIQRLLMQFDGSRKLRICFCLAPWIIKYLL